MYEKSIEIGTYKYHPWDGKKIMSDTQSRNRQIIHTTKLDDIQMMYSYCEKSKVKGAFSLRVFIQKWHLATNKQGSEEA
jgi:hypothetical protein